MMVKLFPFYTGIILPLPITFTSPRLFLPDEGRCVECDIPYLAPPALALLGFIVLLEASLRMAFEDVGIRDILTMFNTTVFQ